MQPRFSLTRVTRRSSPGPTRSLLLYQHASRTTPSARTALFWGLWPRTWQGSCNAVGARIRALSAKVPVCRAVASTLARAAGAFHLQSAWASSTEGEAAEEIPLPLARPASLRRPGADLEPAPSMWTLELANLREARSRLPPQSRNRNSTICIRKGDANYPETPWEGARVTVHDLLGARRSLSDPSPAEGERVWAGLQSALAALFPTQTGSPFGPEPADLSAVSPQSNGAHPGPEPADLPAEPPPRSYTLWLECPGFCRHHLLVARRQRRAARAGRVSSRDSLGWGCFMVPLHHASPSPSQGSRTDASRLAGRQHRI